MESKYLHEVAITGIIVKDGKYLIIQRAANRKRFPGVWTFPGGKLETDDYVRLKKDTKNFWYNVLRRVLQREIEEEVGLQVTNIVYVTSLATVHADGTPSLIISCMADYESGDLVLQKEEADDYSWVTLEESKKYELIDGIYEELVMAENIRNGGNAGEWQKIG